MPRAKPSIEIAGVRLTSPDRVLFPEQGVTKRQLAEYYVAVAEWILPQLRDRPLTLVRCPAGRAKQCFVQRRADETFPPTLRRVEVPEPDGGTATYLAVESLAGVVGLVQLGVLELHTWGSRRDRLDRPDRMIFDLDPAGDVGWDRVAGAAVAVRDRLEALGLRSFVKTSGGKGVHVVVPLDRRHGWEEVRGFAHALAQRMAREEPDRYTDQSAKAERGGRVYLDYLRNGWSASAVAAYSTRSRPGATVSTPIRWAELEAGVDPAEFTVHTVPGRLNAGGPDPWEEITGVRQRITGAMQREVGAD